MKILITGSNGFIGKNLSVFLKEQGNHSILELSRDTPETEFKDALLQCDFVFHLAGVNRPKNNLEFKIDNIGLTSFIIETLRSSGRKVPIMISSSIQAANDTAYGLSKAEAESIVERYAKDTGAP